MQYSTREVFGRNKLREKTAINHIIHFEGGNITPQDLRIGRAAPVNFMMVDRLVKTAGKPL